MTDDSTKRTADSDNTDNATEHTETSDKKTSSTVPGNSVKGAQPEQENKTSEIFYVVGLGASAGGFEALERFFISMPSDSGMAFVIVQHLSPDHKSLMVELLSKHTEMKVEQAVDGVTLQANCIYLIPPKKTMTVHHGRLWLTEKARQHALSFPIDIFLNSLAEDMGERAISIILSGTGSDGTRGIRSVKEQGGLIMVQDLNSAKFDGMPRNAIATGLADYILPPHKMPEELLKYIKHPYVAHPDKAESRIMDDENRMGKVFSILKNRAGLDFTHYKQNTVSRRIERRMSVNQVEKMEDYINFLYQNPREVQTLYKELLIGVTRFFRDQEAFTLLQEKIIPEIVSGKAEGETIRVWVAGCSTGEEAYSLAILFREHLQSVNANNEVKIFATDVDSDALETASMGQYPENIAADLTNDRFQHYFVRKGDKHQVAKPIREMVIFALHNIIKDPPFNKIDLLTCRNMLIYLQPVLQKKVLLNFNFALNENGFLFLGASETIGEYTNLFAPYDTKWKIYRCQGKQTQMQIDQFSMTPVRRKKRTPRVYTDISEDKAVQPDEQKQLSQVYDVLFKDYVPPSAVINTRNQLMHVLGDVSKYLRLQPGDVSLNIIDLIRKDMAIALETGVNKAIREKKAITYKGVRLKEDTEETRVDLKVTPLGGDKRGKAEMYLVVFEENKQVKTSTASPDATEEEWPICQADDQRMQDLEYELQYTKENLQATIEELETTNEELQATNEELLSANEELQSTNEELQSVNEELITVNSEYQSKIQELTELNNDMNNLLASTRIGTIFLDRDLSIRKYTPAVTDAVNVMDSDMGRPLKHISLNVRYDNLVDDCSRVLHTLIPVEKEVHNGNHRWWLVRILPYRTDANTIKGVVVTFIDTTTLKEASAELQKLSKAVEMAPSIVCITNKKGHIEYVNQRFSDVTGYSKEEARKMNINTLKTDETPREQFKELWQTIISGGAWRGVFANCKKNGDVYYEEAAISPIQDDDGNISHFLKVAEDVTERRHAIKQMEASRGKIMHILESTTDSYVELDQDWRFVYANKKAFKLLHTSKEDILEKPFWEVFPNTVETRIFKELHKAKKQQKNLVFTDRFPGLDAILEFHVFPLENGLNIYLRDVTERVEAEEALKHEHKLTLGVARTSPVCITVLDPKGRIVFANQQAEKLFNISLNEITKRGFADVKWDIKDFDGNPVPEEELPFAKVMKSKKQVTDMRHTITTPEGKVVYLSINASPILGPRKKIEKIITAVTDITEDVQRQEELKRHRDRLEKEARLRASQAATAMEHLDALKYLVVGLDEKGIITLVNKMCCEVFEKSEQQLLGADWFSECIPTEHKKAALEIFQNSLKDNNDNSEKLFTLSITSASGEDAPIAWRSKPMLDEDGTVYGALWSGQMQSNQ